MDADDVACLPVVPDFSVPFAADAFPPGFTSRTGVLRFTEHDLAHALFVTGRAPGDRVKYGVTSVWEWRHRTSLIPAYVRRPGSGHFARSALADSLDRSEKIALSYAIGQALTGIFCTAQLGVQHLMHVDRYENRWRVGFGSGRSRPDLFGRLGPRRWLVAEAKGRSNTPDAATYNTVRFQKCKILSIAGHPPVLAVGCLAYFPNTRPSGHGPLRLDAIDPPPAEEAFRLDVVEARFLQTYYEPFVLAIQSGDVVEDDEEGVVASLGERLRVGVRRAIYDSIVQTMDEHDLGVSEEVAAQGDAEVGRWRADGTLVEVEWDEFLELSDYDVGG